MLRLTYKIFPVEKHLPSTTSLKLNDELNQFEGLKQRFADKETSEAVRDLARRLVQSVYREQIIAGMLSEILAAPSSKTASQKKGNDGEKEQKSRRNDKRDKRDHREQRDKREQRDQRAEGDSRNDQSRGERRGRKSRRRSKAPAAEPAVAPMNEQADANAVQNATPVEDAAPKKKNDRADSKPAIETSAPSMTPSKETPDADGKNLVEPESVAMGKRKSATEAIPNEDGDLEIYIDAGRKDGLRISALMKNVVEATDLPRGDIGKVRMLTRGTYIIVPEKNAEQVRNALDGMDIGDRQLKAEFV